MNAIVSDRLLTWKLLAVGFFVVFSGIDALGQASSGQPLYLSELKALSYQQTSQFSNKFGLPSNQDLADTIRLARGFALGSQLLPKYREPILTRGGTGVSVFRSASPSVVLVIVGDVKKEQFEPTGLGTGVVINSTGDILTNWHVIAGYSSAVVFLKPPGKATADENSAYVAQVTAQNSVADLALLHLVQAPSALTPISIGTQSSIQVAEDIHVIGHPNGNLWSYSTGVISQIRASYNWTYEDGSKHAANVLQLQTAISPGNSGGPVLDDQGKLLGLIAMSEEGQNLNYAVAVDVIQTFLSLYVKPARAATAPIRTRGGGGSKDNTYSSSHLKDGRTVYKTVSPDFSEYVVMDAAGKTFSLTAETPNGVILSASEPISSGGFKQWSIELPNGSKLRAEASGAVPERFSSSQ